MAGLKKYIIFCLFCCLLFAGCTDAEKRNSALINKPSSMPFEGFNWQKFSLGGLQFWGMKNSFTSFVFNESDGKINVERRSPDKSVVSKNVFQIFTIKNNKLPAPADLLTAKDDFSNSASVISDIRNCEFFEIDSGRAGVRRFVLKPANESVIVYKKLAKNSAVPSTCGGWGIGNSGMRYFEIFDGIPNKAVFVEIGQEKPLFDESSIFLTE